MLCTSPRGEVVAPFSDHLQQEARTEAVERGGCPFRPTEQSHADVRKLERSPDRFDSDAPSIRLRSGASQTDAFSW